MANLWIVIVNYRTASMVVDCLHSVALQLEQVPGLRVVVVDNDSGDGSFEDLSQAVQRERWEAWVTIAASGRNGGFAFGNNVGIRLAFESTVPADYVFLLNPDTVARDGSIYVLLNFIQLNQEVGIVGGLLENAQGGVDNSAHNAPSPLGELISGANLGFLSRKFPRKVATPQLRNVAHECDWVSGASLMVRREVFEQIGLLDEAFFLYFEEVDFCTRARNAGWEVWFVPDSRILHLEGSATGIKQVARRRPGYWYDSRRRYFVKHFGMLGLIVADVLWATGRLSLALRCLLRLGTDGKLLGPKWFAFDLLWGDIKFVLRRGTAR